MTHDRSVIPPACSLVDVATVLFVVMAAMLVAHTGADPDLWGHLRFGADMLASGGLAVRDPYSFTSDIVWVNHEWLAEVVLAALYTPFGAIGVNLLKTAIVGTVAAIIWRTARRCGASTFSASLITVTVVIVSSTRTEPLRPQLFSILFFTLLLTIGDRIERGDARAGFAVPVLFCLWANAHGGWIVGFGALTLWAVWTRRYLLVVAAAAGTLVNPYGVGLWRFVHDTVGLARPDIADWRPLFGLPLTLIGVECGLTAAAAAAVCYTRRVPPLRHMAIVAMLAFGTVRVSRIDAFLQIAVALICMPAIVDAANALDARLRRSGGLTRASHANALAAAVMIVVAAGFTLRYISRITVDGEWVADGDAMRFIKGNVTHARMITWFDWGEYAIWHLAPNGIQVSMDGRRETVYSDRVLREHFDFYGNTSPDAWQYPDRVGADHVWLPAHMPIVGPLRAHGWHAIYESPTSVVLARDARTDQIARLVTPVSTTRAEFPGP